MKYFSLTRIQTVLLAVGASQLSLPAQTPQYDSSSLSGGYSYLISGSAVDPIFGALTRIAEAGLMTADGAGNLNGSDTVMVDGSLTRRTFTGTYSVNPDGTGSLVLNPSWGPQIHADFFIGQSGSVLRLVITDANNTLSGVLEAQQPSGQQTPAPSFAASLLNGGYDYALTGTGADIYGNVLPIREAGRLTADGAGHLTGNSTVTINGSVVKRTLSGTYSINRDGTGSATLYPSWGPPVDLDVFVSASGLSAQLVVTDQGSTLSGELTAGALPLPPSAVTSAQLQRGGRRN